MSVILAILVTTIVVGLVSIYVVPLFWKPKA